MIDWTSIRDTLVTAILGVIGVALISYLRAKAGEIKWAEVIRWIKIAVDAAEMVHKADPGAIKNEYAKKVLTAAGIDPNLTHVDAAVEAEVFALKHAPEIQTANFIGSP
jgi:hypothetical protein